MCTKRNGKLHILCAIRNEPVRLGQLTRELPTASKKLLTENLRELHKLGLSYVEIVAGSSGKWSTTLRPAHSSFAPNL